MEDIVEIIRVASNWSFVVLILGLVLIIVVRDRITELFIRWKDFQASAKIKPKDVKKLSAFEVRAKAIEPETPPPPTEGVKQVVLKPQARRILATLWDGQNRYYPEQGISKGQWAFRITPNAHEYGNFILGFAQLLEFGFIGWETKHGQAVLTERGMEYIKAHPEIQESKDRYTF